MPTVTYATELPRPTNSTFLGAHAITTFRPVNRPPRWWLPDPGRVEHVLPNGPNLAEDRLPAGRVFRADALSFGLRLDDDPVCLPGELFDVVEGSTRSAT